MRFKQQRPNRMWILRQLNSCTATTVFQSFALIFFIIIFLQITRIQHQRAEQRYINLRGGAVITTKLREQWVTSQAQPFNENDVARSATNLIVVAGHSVTISGHLEDAAFDERDWFLLEYQQHRGLPAAIVGHIEAGIRAAMNDPKSLLIFSGGQTRSITGPESEGSSYYRVADALQLWTHTTKSKRFLSSARKVQSNFTNTVRARTATEEYATDSFENLLFSICRFYEITGFYPNNITVVSFTFKERRFKTLHVPALQYPSEQFHYIGFDPHVSTGFNIEESTAGELQNAAKPFETDPYGCHSKVLQEKRQSRNPFFRKAPYELTCPDMKELLNYCGPEIISKSKVPW